MNTEKDQNKLKELNKFLLVVSAEIIKAGNYSFHNFDLYILSIINRTISLNKAFILLIENENSLTAISIVRLQLDNALRLYASQIVENPEDFLTYFFEGNPINEYKINKQNLTDSFLAKELNKKNPGAFELYKYLCNYVHFSEKHFEATKTDSQNENALFRIVIGNSDVLNENEKKEFYERITSISNTIVKISREWLDTKINLK